MSAATMSGKATGGSGAGVSGASKQQFKSGGSAGGKALDSARKQAASPVDGQKGKQQPPQPKAWQGPNPITQRAAASSSLPNGTKAATPPPPMKIVAEGPADKHAHDRALFLLANLKGQDVTLTLKTGEQFTGVFSGGSFESASNVQYILKMARRTRLPSQQHANGDTDLSDEFIGEGEDHVMLFDKEDTADLEIKDLNLTTALPAQNGSITSSFRTDTEISGRDAPMARQRELQRWDAGDDSGINMSLEDSGSASWDQFAANENMYGVESTYDENIYTTTIDKSDPAYRRREAEAARIAAEIEGTAPANAHVAEERRRDAETGDGLDEEEKYSGVRREAASALPRRSANAYVPPSQRPLTSTPTVPGAPFDPAIISSQLAKPTPPAQPAAEKVAESPVVVEQGTPTDQQQPDEEESIPQPIPAAGSAAIPIKKPENTTEEHVRNVTDAFKQFANSEKLRVRQGQEAKRSNLRNEKNVKLNDLKKFAANFKLKSRVPDDLVPILAKDPHKQVEIQQRADDAAKAEEQKAKDKDKSPSASTSAAASPAQSAISQGGLEHRTIPFQPQPQPTHSRARMSANLRGNFPAQGARQPPSGPNAQMQGPRAFNNGPSNRQFPPAPQPLPADMRIPTGPALETAGLPTAPGPASPPSKLNVKAKAFELRPGASSFKPSGPSQSSQSPQRTASSSMDRSAVSETTVFFENKKPVDVKDRKEFDYAFHAVRCMAKAEYADDLKKAFAANGGVPWPFRTPPTWPVSEANVNVSYKEFFVKSRIPSSGTSPMHTPNSNNQMPHAHQLPPQLQGSHAGTPSQRQPYMAPPHFQQHHQQGYNQHMQQFGPNGSVHSSPRFPPAQVAFNNQMQGMPMPQFPGQQMQSYGMSPQMQYRQPNMPPQGGMMIMPNQQHGQMGPMPQAYPQRGPQFGQPQMMGGVQMVNQPSGGFMNGPMPQGAQSYSPMPPHAQPHMPQHMHQPNGGYGGSPRPHMMQHGGSHQGFQPGMMPPQGPQFAPSPGQPHPYHMQQRQYSHGSVGGYPQMTPRQQHPIPNQTHASPEAGAG